MMKNISGVNDFSCSVIRNEYRYPCNCTNCGKDTHGIGWRVFGACSETCFRAKNNIYYRKYTELDKYRETHSIDIEEDNCKVCGKITEDINLKIKGVCSQNCFYSWKSHGKKQMKEKYDIKEKNKELGEIELSCIYCGEDATDSCWEGSCSRRCAINHMYRFSRMYGLSEDD